MLTHLHIRDLAVIRQLEFELTPGLSVVTGETGAGKSILVDALGLALGDRTDNDMIRTGCERADITAGFNLAADSAALAWLREQSLDNGEDAECLLRRVLVRNGRSRCFINGTPVPMQLVQALAQYLVDIHGQHAHQSLLRRDEQRRLLDGFGKLRPLATELAALFRRYRGAQARLDEMEAEAKDRITRLELLRFQVEELISSELTEGEWTELESRHRRLCNTGRLQETGARLFDRLYENDASIHGQLVGAARELDDLLSLDPALQESRELMENLVILIQEASIGLRSYLESLELDPEALQEAENRISQLYDLARKYRVRPESLPQHLDELSSELAQLEQVDSEVAQLQQEVEELRSTYTENARNLSKKRQSAAKRLGRVISNLLKELGMAAGKFEIAIASDTTGEHPAASGLDEVEFLVSANPGNPPQPLTKVASGGELSRISLAIQVATAEFGTVPTLIFDEVDVGIGGGTAEIVGKLLRQLGKARQVICVTHLAQVAALGHHHLTVTKQSHGNKTFTDISQLEADDRVEEIARMLGGVEITEHALAHAKQMVKDALA